MKKYVRKINLRDRPYDNSISINTREGGAYHSMYSKPLQKLVLGEVALMHSPTLDVPCSVIAPVVIPSRMSHNRRVILQGSVMNTYLLESFGVFYTLGDNTFEIPLERNNYWVIELDPRELYDNSFNFLIVSLKGFDIEGREVLIENRVSINLGLFCDELFCDESKNTSEFLFSFDNTNSLFFNMEISNGIDNKRVAVLNSYEFLKFLTENGLEVEIWSEE